MRHSGVVLPNDPRDIQTREDCERLVRAFYGKAMTDPMIGFLFTDVAKLDLEAHVPVITSFWETMLLGTQTYGGGAFAPHVSLHRKAGLRGPHFERWLALWTATVDELFVGERAEEAKAHAQRVAAAFARRLATLPGEGDVVAEELDDAGGLPVALTITRHGGGDGDGSQR
ncbi:MAG TPA: group III truncated hemoglobin [Baekduia sp.]